MAINKALYEGDFFGTLTERCTFSIFKRKQDIFSKCDDCDLFIYNTIKSVISLETRDEQYSLYYFNLYMAFDLMLEIAKYDYTPPEPWEIVCKETLNHLNNELNRSSSLCEEIDSNKAFRLVLTAVDFHRAVIRGKLVGEAIKYKKYGKFGEGEWYYLWYGTMVPLHPELLAERLKDYPDAKGKATYCASIFSACQELYRNINLHTDEFPWALNDLCYYNIEEYDDYADFLIENRPSPCAIICIYRVIDELQKTINKYRQYILTKPNEPAINSPQNTTVIDSKNTLFPIGIIPEKIKRNKVFVANITLAFHLGFLFYDGKCLRPRIRTPKNNSFQKKQTFGFYLGALLGLGINSRFPAKEIDAIFGKEEDWKHQWQITKTNKREDFSESEWKLITELIPNELLAVYKR